MMILTHEEHCLSMKRKTAAVFVRSARNKLSGWKISRVARNHFRLESMSGRVWNLGPNVRPTTPEDIAAWHESIGE